MKATAWSMVVLAIVTAALASEVVFGQGYGGGGGSDYNRPTTSGPVDALKTAQTHATNSARSETLRDSLWHLGHVVNCLEGPRGKNYDANNANPCTGQGAGIIPDLETAARAYQMGASSALDQARRADQLALDTLKFTDVAQVKSGASKVAEMLSAALKAIGQ